MEQARVALAGLANPLTHLGIAAVLLASAAAAVNVPARRAMALDPLAAFRA